MSKSQLPISQKFCCRLNSLQIYLTFHILQIALTNTSALKKAEKEVTTLEAKKAKADAKAAEEAKKAEAESVLKKLLAEGVSADEILAKLK